MTGQPQSLSPDRRLWITGFFAIAALIAAIGYMQFRAEEKQVSQEWAQSLSAVASLKATQIAEWRKDRLADVLRFSQGPALIAAAKDFIRRPDDAACVQRAKGMLDLNRKGGSYQNTMFVSLSGNILLSSSETTAAASPNTTQAIQSALANRTATFSAIYQDGDQYLIDTVAPVLGEDGTPFAMLAMQTDVSAFLYPLITFWPTDSLTAETVLVRREGNEVVFLSRARHGKMAALGLRLPLTQSDTPAVRAVLGFQGICRGKDYGGRDVMADVRPIRGSDWFLVNKVDRTEIRNEIHAQASVIVRLVGLGILLVAALTASNYRKRQSLLYKNLYRVEKEQREAHERFETILYSIGDAVIVTDVRSRVCQMNPVAEHLTGWREAEALGKPLEEVFRIVDEETRLSVANPVGRVLSEGKSVRLASHTVLISRDGAERPVADSGAPVRDGQGNINGVVLVFRDQSAEYAAQKALRSSEAQYSDLFRNITEGVALHEVIEDASGHAADYRFLKVNPAFEQLTGKTADQTVGHSVLELFPDVLPHLSNIYGQVAREGKTVSLEDYLPSIKRLFRVTAFNLRPQQYCVMFDDITDLKKHEQERLALERQLQQSQRIEAVGRLAGGVAHDFNNMLAVIVGNAELAREHLDPASPIHTDLLEIIKAGRRSAELVKQLLAFASRQTIVPRVLNLNDTIAGMLNMLKRIIGETVTLNWSPSPDLWAVKLDPSQIDQVLVNLTVNARDAMNGTGTVDISTANASFPLSTPEVPLDIPLGDYVQLRVCDTGCGMDDITRAHIFEPFFTTKQNGVGTGLGLSTVYGIVKQNRGFVRVNSKPGAGTRFDIFLPRHRSEHLAEQLAVALPACGQTGTETILLVEDEPSLLVLTQALIRNMGYTVLAAGGPDEAIKLSESFGGTIHLLLTDVVMPGMSGRDLWRWLIRQRPNLKALFVSGYTADIIAHHGVVDDHTLFLQKPFSRESLAAKLRDILSTPKTEM